MRAIEPDDTSARRVILVRHGEPIVGPALPAADWPLSARGAAAVRQVAATLRPHAPRLVVTSGERKAIETGQLIADLLGLTTDRDADLGEQGRGAVSFFPDRATFLARVQEHFRRPDEPVLGDETANAAARFARAVEWHARRSGAPVVLVSHGRIMAGYLARADNHDAWGFWRTLSMPDAYLVDLNPRGGVVHVES